MPSRSQPSRTWQLHEAKARFSELFRLARTQGPQRVTRQQKESVVVLPAEQFDQLVELRAQPLSLTEFFAKAPTGGVTLDLHRKRDVTRNIDW